MQHLKACIVDFYFNVFDIEIKVYYASFQMLHTEVVFLDLTIYYFNIEDFEI